MSGLIEKDLLVGGVDAVASAPFSTDTLGLSRSYEWNLGFTKVGTDGNPILTIEVSNDDVNWTNPYIDDPLGVATPITFTLTDTFTTCFDGILPYKYMRVSGIANGTTTGTIKIKATLVVDA